MTITYGVIGTGWITDSWIKEASKTGKWQLTAVYSRDQEKGHTFAQKYDCSSVYTSLEQFAANASMQAVYIASPNSHHYAQAKQMLEAHKHVLLEKPATATAAELDDLFQIAKQKRVFLIEAYRHVQEANFKVLAKAIKDEKRLGPIYGASFQYASFSSRYANVLNGDVPNIFSLDFAGGALVDVGVYPVTFAVALFGAPQSQTYVPFICRTGVDGGGMIILQYDNFGVQINLAKAYVSTAPCEVYGEKGTITINATTDISTIKHFNPQTKETNELAGDYKKPEKPNVNMEEECAEFARIIEEDDDDAVAKLEEVSKAVLAITQDLRRQNGILYKADREEKESTVETLKRVVLPV